MNLANSRRWALCIAACACQVAGYCAENQASPDIATNAMTPSFSARSTGVNGTDIRASLRVPAEDFGRDYVDLEHGDRLVATRIEPETLEATEKVMFEHGGNAYGVGFRHEAQDTEIRIAFDRPSTGGSSAPDSTVTLPPPLVLDWVEDPAAMTAAPDPFSRTSATPYFVVWDPFDVPDFEPGDELRYIVSGRCIEPLLGVIDWENGEDALQLTGVLSDPAPPNDGKSCPIHVVFMLRRMGTVDPAFNGGTFLAEQIRSIHLPSTP